MQNPAAYYPSGYNRLRTAGIFQLLIISPA